MPASAFGYTNSYLHESNIGVYTMSVICVLWLCVLYQSSYQAINSIGRASAYSLVGLCLNPGRDNPMSKKLETSSSLPGVR